MQCNILQKICLITRIRVQFAFIFPNSWTKPNAISSALARTANHNNLTSFVPSVRRDICARARTFIRDKITRSRSNLLYLHRHDPRQHNAQICRSLCLIDLARSTHHVPMPRCVGGSPSLWTADFHGIYVYRLLQPSLLLYVHSSKGSLIIDPRLLSDAKATAKLLTSCLNYSFIHAITTTIIIIIRTPLHQIF